MLKIVHIYPKEDFKSSVELLELASGLPADEQVLHLFDVPLVSVIVDNRGLPVGVPNQFLAHLSLRSRSATGDTVRTYAEALVTWLKFIAGRRFRLEDATEERLAMFRNYLANLADKDGKRHYSPATVNNRIAVTEAFYSWAQKRAVMATPLGEFLCNKVAESQSRSWHGSHALRRSSDSLRVGVIQRMPRVLSFEEISRLFVVVRPPFALMFRWALATGMRRFEVCALRRSLLPTAAQIAAKGAELVPIEITRKGGRSITAHAPAALVEETLWYCLTERPQESSRENGDYVFLSRRGMPYSRGSLSREFRRCADMVGTDATLHHLRHTFAILVLGILESFERRGRPMNSIKAVQILLGHANVTTTELYLRALGVSSEDVRDALDFLYGAPRWPPQTAPLMAGQTAPGRTVGL